MDDNEANIIRRLHQHRLSVDGIYSAITRRSSARASISSQLDPEDYLEGTPSPGTQERIGRIFGGDPAYERLREEHAHQANALRNLRRCSGISGISDFDDKFGGANAMSYQIGVVDEEDVEEEVEDNIVEQEQQPHLSEQQLQVENYQNENSEEIDNIQAYNDAYNDALDEPDVDIKVELTQDDIDHTWSGMVDTNVPKTAAPQSSKPLTNVVCEAISDISKDMREMIEQNYLDNQLNDEEKAAEIAMLHQNSQEVQEDMAQFIQRLSEKLTDPNGAAGLTAEEHEQLKADLLQDTKSQMLREENARMEQFKEEKALMIREKNLRAIQEERAEFPQVGDDDYIESYPADYEEAVHLVDERIPSAIDSGNDSEEAEEEEENQEEATQSNPTLDPNSAEKLDRQNKKSTVSNVDDSERKHKKSVKGDQGNHSLKKKKKRTPEEKAARAQRKAEKEERKKIREEKRRERELEKARERKTSGMRRRKTSSRKLSRLKMEDRCDELPNHTWLGFDDSEQKKFVLSNFIFCHQPPLPQSQTRTNLHQKRLPQSRLRRQNQSHRQIHHGRRRRQHPRRIQTNCLTTSCSIW